jgi:peptidoglycan/LPS O-acetylase OafA/YrhL
MNYINTPQEKAVKIISANRENYIPTLDGWRAIAILLVMAAHGSDSFIRCFLSGDINLQTWSHREAVGLFGVKIFFALSGLLITTKLLDEESRKGNISLYSFYVRRAFRILPASLLFLLVIGLLSCANIIPVSINRWRDTLFFFANYSSSQSSWYLGHFWSLAVEEHFYFIWPLTFFLLKNNRHRVVVVILAAFFVAIWRMTDFKFGISGSTPAVFWGRTDIQADGILWGVAAALISRSKYRKISSLQGCLTKPFVLYALGAILAAIAASEWLMPLNWKLNFFLLTAKAVLIPILLLTTVTQSKSWVGHLLENSVLRWIGRLSYSIYIWQQLFLVWRPSLSQGMSPWQNFPLNLVGVVLISCASYYFIEQPFVKMGHRISSKTT